MNKETISKIQSEEPSPERGAVSIAVSHYASNVGFLSILCKEMEEKLIPVLRAPTDNVESVCDERAALEANAPPLAHILEELNGSLTRSLRRLEFFLSQLDI